MGSVELQIPFPHCRYSHQLQEGAQGLCLRIVSQICNHRFSFLGGVLICYCWGMLKKTESITQTGLSKRRLIESDDRTIWFQALSDSVSKRIGRDLFRLLKWLLFFFLSLSCQFMSTFHIILTALSVLCITKRWGKETPCLAPFTIFIVSIGSIVLSVKSRSMCQGHGTAPSFSFKK